MSNGGEQEDFISKLPDDVVGHILSYLDTIEAVQTSALSKRWRFLWTYIHTLEFHDFPALDDGNQMYMDFMDHVLGLCKSQNMKKFTLRFHGFERESDLPHVMTWIHYALSRNVKELDLFLRLGYEDINPVKLPYNFSSCKSLVELILINDYVFALPSTIECFPSLKVLHVYVRHLDCSFLSELFSSEIEAYQEMEMLKGIRNGEALTLSACTAAALSHSFALRHDLPTFPFLKRLEFGIYHEGGWKLWPHFLTNSPILECLVLERESMELLLEELDELERELDVEAVSGWNPPESVPYCLLQHLKEIRMRYLWGLPGEVQAIQYLLENGHFLEKMCIHFDDETAFARQLDKYLILNFPRASGNCVIEIV
ncbi:hypothetical protein DITRI_Ditri17bG0004300 [Diplodiscus trichospermus]